MARRIRVGNLYGISLPNGKMSFGRLMRDGGLAIYNHIGNNIFDLPQNEQYQFIVSIFNADINRDLIYISNIPFATEELEWPPPSYICDAISHEYRIYHKGEISPSSKDKCIGLEQTAVWNSCHIIDRIMGDDKWGGILKE